MSSQRYERVSPHDEEDDSSSPISPHQPSSAHRFPQRPIPNSPPPSFRSRASSPTSRLLSHDPLTTSADRTLADTFDPSDSDSDSDSGRRGSDDARQRLVRRTSADGDAQAATNASEGLQRRMTEVPTFSAAASSTPRRNAAGRGYSANDGVFANLSAKPTPGEELDEKPPSYEQAAADATPPYWETTILAPGTLSDDVFIDGLPVGSLFSFVWNAMISVSFQVIGFLLTYLLHTTHAAKNGSKAGLGITMVQYGFAMKGAPPFSDPVGGGGEFGGPADPDAHDFDPETMDDDVNPGVPGDVGGVGGLSMADWMAYVLMIVGWFILIRSVSDYLRARRHEQLVLQSPERGLGVPVVAEGERPETSV
ncbi:hypothetical protein P152DRAFT_454234 [Eremomyces bilateralis CBS 781.70]|uniref:Metal homeostatis protein bsd2 n=1 Tax=Eremomyces bilateralis CBS 781.70 TaxID=1392243 RepID=A0A6G1GHY0_9PEZI|nr:uncharacterized protein P152DRAFT_454234 [Eremomyces bilateralis CBS 781.70]KAF1817663.1 hypothetical protein P152DRAFT_454234 [Eremomyces bilateralis CBS 781.70]